jgi:hypothetical protein
MSVSAAFHPSRRAPFVAGRRRRRLPAARARGGRPIPRGRRRMRLAPSRGSQTTSLAPLRPVVLRRARIPRRHWSTTGSQLAEERARIDPLARVRFAQARVDDLQLFVRPVRDRRCGVALRACSRGMHVGGRILKCALVPVPWRCLRSSRLLAGKAISSHAESDSSRRTHSDRSFSFRLGPPAQSSSRRIWQSSLSGSSTRGDTEASSRSCGRPSSSCSSAAARLPSSGRSSTSASHSSTLVRARAALRAR